MPPRGWAVGKPTNPNNHAVVIFVGARATWRTRLAARAQNVDRLVDRRVVGRQALVHGEDGAWQNRSIERAAVIKGEAS